jgi:hypothetical protein
VALHVGDRIEEQARSTERPSRAGVIKELVHEEPRPRYRIHWDDGHESVYTPADGCLHRSAGERRASARAAGGRARR